MSSTAEKLSQLRAVEQTQQSLEFAIGLRRRAPWPGFSLIHLPSPHHRPPMKPSLIPIQSIFCISEGYAARPTMPPERRKPSSRHFRE
jgi:hypothetical protein